MGRAVRLAILALVAVLILAVPTENAAASSPSYVNTALPSGATPVQAILSPNGTYLWVSDAGNDAIYIYPTLNQLAVVHTISVGGQPFGIVFSPNGSDVWVAVRSPNEALEYSATTYALLHTVGIGVSSAFPYLIAITPNGSQVWVTDYYHNVTIIHAQTATILTEFLAIPYNDPLGVTTAVSFSPNGTQAFLGFTNLNVAGVLVAYNTSRRTVEWTANLNFAGSIAAIGENPNSSVLYVLNDSVASGNFNVVVPWTGVLVAQVAIPLVRFEDFAAIALSPDASTVWFAGSHPPTQGDLVAVSAYSYAVVADFPNTGVEGSTSFVLDPWTNAAGRGFAISDAGSPFLTAWAPLYPDGGGAITVPILPFVGLIVLVWVAGVVVTAVAAERRVNRRLGGGGE